LWRWLGFQFHPDLRVGDDRSATLVQVTLEQAHHTSELIALFWQQDIEPPEMTRIDVRMAIAGIPGPS